MNGALGKFTFKKMYTLAVFSNFLAFFCFNLKICPSWIWIRIHSPGLSSKQTSEALHHWCRVTRNLKTESNLGPSFAEQGVFYEYTWTE